MRTCLGQNGLTGAGPRLISGRRGRGVFHGVGAGRMA